MQQRRVVVVTGASAGIGRACVRAFAERGYDVALLARGRAGLRAAAEEVRACGGRAVTLVVDTSDHELVEAAAGRVEDQLGPIDVWVNDAFATVFAPFEEISPEEYERATRVTYLGYVNGTRAALRRMRPRDRGVIVHVGSALAYRGVPLQSAYCGAKHAVQGFHDSLRAELLHHRSGVKVTMVQMPAMNTPQFRWGLSRLPRQAQPVPPIYQPEIAARAVVYAAEHPGRREWWVGTSTALTIAANAVVPGLLDRYLARTGVSSQQTDEERPDDQPSNLWEPVDAEDDHGAHGVFDHRAHALAPQLWATQHRGALLGAASGIGALAAMAAVRPTPPFSRGRRRPR